jgi:hypothetical protein
MRRREFIAGLGGAVVRPLAARAQQQPMPAVGVFNSDPAAPDIEWGGLAAAFRHGIGEQGYLDGRDVEILYRYAEKSDSLPELAAEFVRRRVAVVFTVTTPADTGDKESNRDDSNRIFVRCRSGSGWTCCEPQPSGRQRHRHDFPCRRFSCQASGTAPRSGACGEIYLISLRS